MAKQMRQSSSLERLLTRDNSPPLPTSDPENTPLLSSYNRSDEEEEDSDDDFGSITTDQVENIPAATNGTLRSIVAGMVSSRTSTAFYTSVLQSRVQSLRSRAADLSERATQLATERVNNAFEGRDAVEMMNTARSLVPRVSFPTNRRNVERGIDNALENVSEFVHRNTPTTPLSDNIQGARIVFAEAMGKKARKALVEQGICKEFQVMPSRRTIGWQQTLQQALMAFYKRVKDEYGLSTLTGMTPFWTGNVARNEWDLAIDTGIENFDLVLSEAVPLHLTIDFSLPASLSSVPKDQDRKMSSVPEDEDWEMMED